MAATTVRAAAGGHRSTVVLAETNQLVSGRARLLHVTVWNVGTSATLDIYDATSGTTSPVFSWVSADGRGTWAVNCPMGVGLRVISGGTFGGANIVWS
jgi:hypothetical protein